MDKENVACRHNRILITMKKRNMSLAGKWTEKESTMLSKLNQTQKDNYCRSFFSYRMEGER
jgi:hypothetical protein